MKEEHAIISTLSYKSPPQIEGLKLNPIYREDDIITIIC